MKKQKTCGGAAHIRRTAKKAILVYATADQHAAIRAGARADMRSLSQFLALAGVAAAEKILEKS